MERRCTLAVLLAAALLVATGAAPASAAGPKGNALELTYIDTWLPVLDILSKHLNGLLADPKVDPVKALADADREAQAKVAEIRKK